MRFPGFEGEWERKYLGDVAVIARGKSKHRPRDAALLYGGKYPFIQTGDVKSAGLYLDKYTQTYSDAGLKQSKLWDENTLCITIAANIAETTILKIKACFPDSIIGLIPYEKEASVLFIKHQFDKFKVDVQKLSQGIAQANLNQEKLSSIQFSFPSLIEQEKIATLLSLIDQRIETQNKIIEDLNIQMLGLQEKFFRQKIKLKNKSGKQFPGWKYKNGVDLFDSISNKNHNSDLPILAITQDYGAIPRDLIEYQITVTNKSIENYKVVEIGDFIISLRSFQGGIEYSNYNGICSPAYIILRSKIEIVSDFYKYYFKTPYYIQMLNKKLEGIRDGKMISYTYFSEISLPFPDLVEQKKIADILSALEQKIEIENKIMKTYKAQKQYLLESLFI